MNYYFTDYEELEALRKENAKLKVENSKLMDLSADTLKEAGKANSHVKMISELVLDHIVYDKEGVAQYIEAKPLLALLDKLNGGKK